VVRDLADLALIGTVADVAPILGENRAIARIGLSRLRSSPRPGLAALLERAGVAHDRVDLDDIGFVVAPRLNAAGRVGEAARAARLLLADNRIEAEALAAEIEKANLDRREMTRVALAEARRELGLDQALDAAAETGDAPAAPSNLPDALLVRGEWPVGIIGLVAGRLAEDLDRPAVVATLVDPEADILRASCRSPGGCNLAEVLIACQDLLIRHGGHAAAAGFDIAASRWPEFTARFRELASRDARPAGPPELAVDLVLPADSVDYGFVREIAFLDPTGVGNPVPTIGITGLRVVRVRAASGGHTQLVLGRGRDVLDAVAFRRSDLPAMLHQGDRIDVVARATSREFGGFESIQLEVVDVAAEGAQPATAGASRVTQAAATADSARP
jgi:single-stranded-DNA-specific exonuclease